MIIADDGGAQISFDGGSNWSTYQNQPTAQIYRISTDNDVPYHILGAQQDNSTIRIVSRSEHGEIGQRDWTSTAGFESGYVVADPSNPDIVYGGNYAGFLSRYDHKTEENRAISVWPDLPIGTGADAHKYRFQWNFPIFFSPHNPKRLYAAGNMLFVSEDEGASWKTISPDLTTNDKSKQGASGGPITKDNTTVEFYCTIFTAAESQLEKDVLWVGSDDGLIHISKDGGANWINVTPPAAGKLMMWNSVELDPFQKGKAYFVGTKYKTDDFKPYIFVTEDYGKSWKLITKGIDSKHFTRVMRIDPKRKGLLYCGTEYGFYMSYDDGVNWKKVQLNLPETPITDMCIKDNSLVIATQGRAIWVMDDLSPIQNFNSKLLTEKMVLYDIANSTLIDGWQNKSPKNAGMNPPNGVIIPFHLKNYNDTVNVEIVIRDSEKKLISTYSSKSGDEKLKLSVKEGMNLFVWDMNYKNVEPIAGMILWNGSIHGPKAAPGTYTATLKIKGDSIEKSFLINSNPKYKCSNEDYVAKTTFLLEVKGKFADVQNCVKDIRTLRGQINQFNTLAGKDIPKEVKSLSDSILKKITKIEEELYQTKLKSSQDILNYPMKLNDRISGLYNYASSGNTAPNKQVKDAYTELKTLADEQLNLFKVILEMDVAELNSKIKSSELPVIGIIKK